MTGASNVTGNRTLDHQTWRCIRFAKTTAYCFSWMPPRHVVATRWMCRHWESMCFILRAKALHTWHRPWRSVLGRLYAVRPGLAAGCSRVGGSGVHSFDEHHLD